MIVQAPKPNVENLQCDAIALLKEIGFLMDSAANALSADSSSDKYKDFQEEVLSISRNVEKLELMMAIVAPMKAGKSTIINAIAGQEILPSRNAAMTTLPTQIVFNPDLAQPTLTLSPEIISVYQQTLQALQAKIQTLGMQRIQDKIAQYPHLEDLLPKIQDPAALQLQEITSGREEIIKVLMSLNDIVRLCNTIDPATDPLGRLTEVPCIQVPTARSRSLAQSDAVTDSKPDLLGNLVIVDTPGPNEAGENLKLATVVAEQLKQSSMVLIVLDFTQLKTEAAEQVKRDVQQVIDLRGKDNLYILVNKVDQRREGDMTSEQLRHFIAAEFGIGNDETNQVFEVSARRAFSAAHFIHELEQSPELSLSELPAARVLAQEVFGIDWEEELAEVTPEEILKKAQRLWNKSGFEPFLEKAVKALMERAAPRCLKSALNLGRSRLMQLRDEVKLRSSAICQDAEKLQLELYALEADLHRLELCRSRLKDADLIKSQLHQNLYELLQVLKREATVNLEMFFVKEEYERADLIKKMDIKARELFLTNIGDFELFPKWVSSRLKSQVEFKTSGLFEFESPEAAEEFVDQAVTYVKQRADSLLSSVRDRTSQEIEQARKSLLDILEQETKPIIEGARQRLNEAFNLDLSLPSMQWESFETMGFVRPPVKRQSRFVDRGNVEVLRNQRQWWHWLWIVPVEVKVQIRRPRVIEDYYTVSLKTLIAKVNHSIEESIDNINLEVNKYLDEDFQQRVDRFFANLDTFLHNYRDNLSQAQADQKLSLEEKEKLVEELSFLLPEATAQIQTAETYIECTDQMLQS